MLLSLTIFKFQAVVSPTSNSVIEAPSMDSFSIDGDYDGKPRQKVFMGSAKRFNHALQSHSIPYL